jgi:hypothetical protein
MYQHDEYATVIKLFNVALRYQRRSYQDNRRINFLNLIVFCPDGTVKTSFNLWPRVSRTEYSKRIGKLRMTLELIASSGIPKISERWQKPTSIWEIQALARKALREDDETVEAADKPAVSGERR